MGDKGRVLVTGARGFIGTHVCRLLVRAGFTVRGASRGAHPPSAVAGEWVRLPAMDAGTDWNAALEGVDAVVHLAGRVHLLRDEAANPLAEYRSVNVAATEGLARQAAACGVRRFVFMSSVKVHGERTAKRDDGTWQRFSEADEPHPLDPYAVSKWEAEQVLGRVAHETGMEIVVLRPPLVYGPGVGANFLRLLRAVQRGMPLPFARVDNLRSLVYVENLAEAVLVCLDSAAAANKTYLVSDVDVSTPDLIHAIARTMARPSRLVSVPLWMLRLAGTVTFRRAAVSRLLDSLLMDDSRIRGELYWSPPHTMQEGLARTVTWLTGKAYTAQSLRLGAGMRG